MEIARSLETIDSKVDDVLRKPMASSDRNCLQP
ncbi:MAG: hypothetical protein ACJAR2_003977 [Ilumatobacter sp.]|jgi:hypothetical protein